MGEPIIEITRPCEHESMHGHYLEHEHNDSGPHILGNKWGPDCPTCPGGSRVRLSRQEAIDLVAEAAFKDRGWRIEWDHPSLDKVYPTLNRTASIRSDFEKHAKALVDALLGATE